MQSSLTGDPVASSAHDTDQDLAALMKSMNIDPKDLKAPVYDSGYNDVIALMELHAANESEQRGDLPDRPKGMKPVSSQARARYLQRLQAKNKSMRNKDRIGRDLVGLESETCRLSKILLNDQDPCIENIRSSFASTTQELLIKSMKVSRPVSERSRKRDEDAKDQGAVRVKQSYDRMRSSTERLAKRSDAYKVDSFSKYDDSKECTFKPKLRKKAGASRGNDDDAKYSFLDRQEAGERMRREDLQHQIGQTEYEAKVDKKYCPSCGAKQSYDEVKEKRKLCPNCQVEYSRKLTWGSVSKAFFKHEYDYARKVAEKKERIRKEIDEEAKLVEKKVIDPSTGALKVVQEKIVNKNLSAAEEQEFFLRLADKLKRRQEKVNKIEQEVYTQKYPFKPTITKMQRYGSDSEDEDSEVSDPFEAFLERYEEDLEHRREKLPEKYLPSRRSSELEASASTFRTR